MDHDEDPPEDIGMPFRMSQLEICAGKAGFNRVRRYHHAQLDTMALYVIQ